MGAGSHFHSKINGNCSAGPRHVPRFARDVARHSRGAARRARLTRFASLRAYLSFKEV